MSTFDELAKENSDLINNFRPTQPLNGRIVYDMDCTSQVRYKNRKNFNLILHNFSFSRLQAVAAYHLYRR